MPQIWNGFCRLILMFKKLPVIVVLLLFCFPVLSQTESPVGAYYLQMGQEDSRIIEYDLTLHPDGAFSFHSHTRSSEKIGIPEEVHQYGRGTWIFQDKKVLFFSDREKDLNEEFTLDFGNSRAHFLSKSPRSLSDRPFQTRLKFFESGIFWIEGIEMLKR